MSNEPRRDESVDRLLRTSMRDALPGPTTACVDAETLAAWADGGLPARERARVEAHVSSCANCQGLAAVFARSMPEPAGSAAAVGLLGGWRLGWLAAVTTAAAAVTIWVMVPRETSQAPLTQTMASHEPIPQAAPPSIPPANADVIAGPTTPADGPAGATAGRNQSAEKSQSLLREGSRAERPEAAATPAPSAVVGAIASPPPAPPASAPIQAASGEGSSSVTRQQLESLPTRADGNFVGYVQLQTGFANSDAAAAQRRVGGGDQNNFILDGLSTVDTGTTVVAEVTPAVQGGQGIGMGRGAMPAAGRNGSVAAAEAASTAPVVARWRIFANGQVDRVTTAAPAGQRVVFDQPVFMTAGSAPSALVCWLVGRGGAVARTVDGEHFRSVAFPEATDLKAVTAANALQATVSTVSGATYVTTDGGATWRQFGR